MANLYLLQYNNYYNRVVKKFDTLEEYLPYQVGNTLQGINFIPNDYINTTQIINGLYENHPDYLIVADEYNEIVSRWFITSATRTRKGQNELTLLRDLIADYYDEVLSSTAYIRKGTISTDNPLIYNGEGMSFNQIKTREDLLYDKTGTPWIVGYVDSKATDLQGATIDFSSDDAPLTQYEEILELSRNTTDVIEGIPVIAFQSYYRASSVSYFNIYNWEVTPGGNIGSSTIVKTDSTTGSADASNTSYHLIKDDRAKAASDLNVAFVGQSEVIKGLIASTQANTAATNSIINYNNKVVFDSTSNKYYRISVIAQANVNKSFKCNRTNSNPRVWDYINPIIVGTESFEDNKHSTSSNNQQFTVKYTVTPYRLTLEEIKYGNYSVTLHDSAKILIDAPYRMFCMKYTPQNYMLAINLATNNGEKIYDVQLLPYCPVQENFYDDGSMINLSSLVTGKDYEPITEGPESTEVLDYLFWASHSVGTFNIMYEVQIENIKQEIECDLYRLCSPNGNGVFEFNAARNGGINYINVDYSYRPYDPYIHLNPDFSELYGQDFNDFRGLVLNGDFSIPKINDAWTQYTIQNKNYQNIFNREIQSLELQNKIAYKQDVFNAVAGTVQGGVTGAAAGGMAGGPWGAVAGAAVGTIASGVGGAMDVYYNQQLRNDQFSLKNDLFSYNLQNIQALPQSVSKTGCLTNNNKLVPYIEYYTCTDKEKEVLQQKLKWLGMTVGAMGIINDYVIVGNGEENASYIEANIVRLDINEDYHISMEIAKEMRGGVRFA